VRTVRLGLRVLMVWLGDRSTKSLRIVRGATVLSMMDKGIDFGGPLIASGKIFTVDVT
jgi:hypothetical protein